MKQNLNCKTMININLNRNIRSHCAYGKVRSRRPIISLQLDDKFNFDCEQCNKFCRNLSNLILTPRDIFNISKALNIEMSEFIVNYCEVYLDPLERSLLVRLKTIGANRQCILFKGGQCAVQDTKPESCSLKPIERIFKDDNGEEITSPKSIRYFVQPTDCDEEAKEYTIREWLEARQVSAEDDFPIIWNKLQEIISTMIRSLEKQYKDTANLKRYIYMMFLPLYVMYDTSKDFKSQFIDHAANSIYHNVSINDGYYKVCNSLAGPLEIGGKNFFKELDDSANPSTSDMLKFVKTFSPINPIFETTLKEDAYNG